MNKRSNSSEDNVIRTLVSGMSRNRYAGAGASELVYPSDHILNYIALNWAAQTVTGTWTKFDEVYKDKSKENNRAKMKGLPYNSDITPEKVYIETVDAENKKNNPFAKSTRRASYNYDKDGFSELGPKWIAYVNSLIENVKENSETSDIAKAREDAQSGLSDLKASGKELPDMTVFAQTYADLRYYRDLVKRHADDIGRVTAYSLFKFDDGTDVTLANDKTKIETYLKENNQFMHPNAVRYFLYQTLQTLKNKHTEYVNKLKDFDDIFKGYDDMFDNPKTQELVETVEDFSGEVNSANPIVRFFKNYEKDIKRYLLNYTSYINDIDEYRVVYPYVIVLEAAIEYIDKLNKSFEIFFGSFETNISEIQRQIKSSEEKYRNRKGNTIRYVCSSKKCLDKFYDRMEFTGNAIEIPDDLCRNIYKKVRTYSQLPDSSKTPNYFKDIFENEIIKHFKNSVEQAYGNEIRMDIIRALEVEAEFEEGIQERRLITEYVKKVIKETKDLAAPFINRPLGEESVPIPACTYNENLYITDNPERNSLIDSELKSFGGEPSKDEEGITKERILFYSAIYGLFPSDLLKFAPAHKSKPGDSEAGEYNKVYFDMINRIGPDPLTTKVITPHLHKYWHLISEMPDICDEEQEMQEKKIYKALILGILYDKIRYEKDGETYKYTLWLLGSKKETPLKVSNGTPCDTFWEVIDALTINPVIVNDLLNTINKEIEIERKANIVNFEKTKFAIGLENLKLQQISNDERKMSIFGIAMAYKITMPADEFIAEQGQMLLETIMESLYEQVEILCPENERNNTYAKLVEDQIKTFKQNIGLYKKDYPSVLKDYLRQLLHVVMVFLHEKGLTQAAENVDKFSKEYFNSAKHDNISSKKEAE